ncbi:MAG TPA: hypothetical protein VLA49_05470 [Anaerolineales bacterium]|nr:hypothetical protein [Anaerolineales bacterium]
MTFSRLWKSKVPNLARQVPKWAYLVAAILTCLVVASLLLVWTTRVVPIGEDFSAQIVDPAGNPVQVVFDPLSLRDYFLWVGDPPVLEGKILPSSAVNIVIPESETHNQLLQPQNGFFRLPFDQLKSGNYHILASSSWLSRRDLWMIYRPKSPVAEIASLFNRSLSVRLAPARADLVYLLNSREGVTEEQRETSETLSDLLGNRLPASVFLNWAFYIADGKKDACNEENPCFSGRDFTSLEAPKISIVENTLRIEIAAQIRAEDYLERLDRLLLVKSSQQDAIPVEIETEGLELANVAPLPDEKEDERWMWRNGPVSIAIAQVPVGRAWERPGEVGLSQIRSVLNLVGEVITGLILMVLPAVPFSWWLLLVRRKIVPARESWPIWLSFLLWFAPLVLLLVFFLLETTVEVGIFVMAGAALAVALLGLVFSPHWIEKPGPLVIAVSLTIVAIPPLMLVAQIALRSSWLVALVASLLILSVLRLTASALEAKSKLTRSVWVLIWIVTILLAFPAEVPGYGFIAGTGWTLFLWPQYFILLELYLLPYIVLAAILRLLRDKERNLAVKPTNLIAIGRLLFAFFLVGALRGIRPGLQELPPIFPLAFAIAFLIFPKLIANGEKGMKMVRKHKKLNFQRQAKSIQRALDVQRARKALNKLIESDTADTENYEKNKKQLLAYIQKDPSLESDALQTEKGEQPAGQPAEKDMRPGQDDRSEKGAGSITDVFRYGPYPSSWENGLLGSKRALFISGLLLLVYLPVIADRAGNQEIPFILFAVLASDILPLLVKWVLLGFFLGYFFPYLRGTNGWQKGLILAIGIAACTVPHDLLNGAGLNRLPAIGIDVAQTALILTVLGLWAFDYEVLRKNGHDLRRLLVVHNLTFLASFGTSVIAAVGSTIVGLITGQINDLLQELLNLITPGGQPPI